MKLLKKDGFKKIPDGLTFRERSPLSMTVKQLQFLEAMVEQKPARTEMDSGDRLELSEF